MIIMTNNNTTTTAAAAVNLPIHSTDRVAPPPSVAPHSHSTDMSPLTAVLSLLILVAVPALIYALFFAINCPRISLGRARRRRQGGVDSSYASSSGGAGKESKPLELASGGFKYSKEADGEEKYGSECPVCLSAFSEGDLLRQLGNCKHTFHVACIDKWLCSHSNCPVCRASVPTLIPVGRMKRPAPAVEDDFRQGLPDAASLV